MKGLVIFLVLVSVTVGQDALLESWNLWKHQHRKVYSSEKEEANKKQTWLANLRNISHMNLENLSFVMKLNQFADMVSIITVTVRY